jgi:DNA-binding CsgD family transcriptional regulator
MARVASRDIVVLGSRRKARLEAIVRRPSSSQALARRARIVLLAHEGWPNSCIAAGLGCTVNTVRTWRRRFVRGGMPALRDRPRSGRPEVYGPGRQAGHRRRCHLGPARGNLGYGLTP